MFSSDFKMSGNMASQIFFSSDGKPCICIKICYYITAVKTINFYCYVIGENFKGPPVALKYEFWHYKINLTFLQIIDISFCFQSIRKLWLFKDSHKTQHSIGIQKVV